MTQPKQEVIICLHLFSTIQLQHERISCDLNRMLPFIVDSIPAITPTQNRIEREDRSAAFTICTRWSSALLAVIHWCTRAMAATADFSGREKLWMESIAAARRTTTATHRLIAFFTRNTLYLISGSAIGENHFAVGYHTHFGVSVAIEIEHFYFQQSTTENGAGLEAAPRGSASVIWRYPSAYATITVPRSDQCACLHRSVCCKISWWCSDGDSHRNCY